MASRRHVFISIAGVIGAGKTSATNLLRDEVGFHVLEENVGGNEFLPLFYKNPKRWALTSQLFYLRDQAEQLRRVRTLLRRADVVQDCPITESFHMYSKALHHLGHLSVHEMTLYENLFSSLTAELPAPHLIIQLNASVPTLMGRIRSRARSFERAIERSYIELLFSLHNEWLASHTASPVLHIDTEKLDIASNPRHQKKFISHVRKAIEKVPV